MRFQRQYLGDEILSGLRNRSDDGDDEDVNSDHVDNKMVMHRESGFYLMLMWLQPPSHAPFQGQGK